MSERSVRCQEWCGACYENAKGRGNHKGHYRYRPPKPPALGEREVFELKKRVPPAADKVQAGQILAREDGLYPALVSMLTSERFPDGSPRQTSSITLFYSDGAMKACLNDRDADLTAWCSSDTLTGLLETLEAGLQGDRLDWRKGGKRTQRKK